MKDWLKPEKTLKASFCWAYYNVPLKIIAEEYIEDLGNAECDYKFFCFHGEPKYFYVTNSTEDNKTQKITHYDINLTINKGETVALVGNSGGGKSTLVNLIPRFFNIVRGQINIDGISVSKYTLESLRKNIAIVFQDNFLFAGTIRENIMLGKQNATEEEFAQAVKMACLDEFISTLKDGFDTQIGERGILLSGGQKQRVAIARAFLKDAPIIILDEATSALDNKAEAIVQKAIDNLMKDKTVFVIAHRLSTVQNANKIAVINEGELVELGNHNELMQIENGQYKTLYEMQFKKQEISI